MQAEEARRLKHMFSWVQALASLLPIWLLALAITVEGFPGPTIPPFLAVLSVICAAAVCVVLLLNRWMTLELVIYSAMPLLLMLQLDEIATGFKTPFIFLVAFVLSAGAISYQLNRATAWRWVFLVLGAALALMTAQALAENYWHLVGREGLEQCYPRCLPPIDQAHPWWRAILES